jgi:hypothetical protein
MGLEAEIGETSPRDWRRGTEADGGAGEGSCSAEWKKLVERVREGGTGIDGRGFWSWILAGCAVEFGNEG